MMPLLSDHTHPNPLASHALTPAPMNGAANLSAGPQSQAAATASRPSTAAKSDFGPRHPAIESADEGGSVEGGHFKIRHGWDDQLNSEEYSHLLTSVRYTGWFSCCGEGRIQDCG
jgi:regulator-associated protein of mTOR